MTTDEISLRVSVPPAIPSNLQGKVLERDFSESATLLCQAEGVPEPTLEWFFNGRAVSTLSTGRHTEYSNGSLEITGLDLPDAGKYQCFATNDAGEKYIAVTLNVNSAPPQIVEAPENLTIVEQSDARFLCKVTGAPTPTITWMKVVDGVEQEVVFGGRLQKVRPYLLIASVEKADSGIYKCHAQNLKGEQSAQAHLTVITKTQIIRPPQNQTVILSTQVRFECGVTQDDNTVPVWEWFFYKGGSMNNEKQLRSTGRYQILDDGTLIVNGVAAQDIGVYKCHVISTGGNDSRIASLNVIELPRPPTIHNVTLNENENNSVVMVWTKAFDGNSPLIKYIITFRQENPNGNNDGVGWEVYPDEVQPSATRHVVSNLQPSRYYRFRISAVNSVGEGNASQPMPKNPLKMPTQPPSSPPRNFFCTQGGEGEIVATWDPPEESTWNGDLQGYILRYKVANLPDLTLRDMRVPGAQKRSHTIPYLVAYKQYAVSLAAYNEEGIGAISNPFYVWTREARPTSSPQNVVATATNSTTVFLQWDPPNAGEINGRNLGYMIEVLKNGTQVRSFFVSSDPNNMEGRQTREIYDLAKFTEYTLTIACQTSPGPGPFSQPVTVKTQEDVPGPVGDLKFDNVQDRSLRVTWSAPSESNGILTGYVLKFEKKNLPATSQTLPLPDTVTSYTIRDLVPITNYTIYVSAKTTVGAGQVVSADIQSGVPPELPHPPYNLGYSNIGARTVLLQFFPGFDGKTSITQWIVHAREVDNEENDDYQQIYTISDPNAREIWVQNLKPFTKYQLKIIAENVVGQSAPSEPTRPFETLQAPPGVPPGNVTVRPLNATAFRISWTPIPRHEWNGVPRGYRIDYRMWSTEAEDKDVVSVHEATWTTLQLENGMNIDSYILVNLQEWMDYQIRMISYNDIGESSYSSVTTAKTRESTPSASPSSLQGNSVGSTRILVTWGPVPRLEQNGQILGYKVLYKPSESINTQMFENVEGVNTLNVTLEGLRKFVSYKMEILAYTRMGDGRLSGHIIRKTDEDVPGPPIIIYFPNVTYTSAIIVWSSPSDPNGIITGYKVSYRKHDETNSELESELGPRIFEYSVDALQRETRYVFSVTARTRLGWGETASLPVLTMLNRGRPDQPRKPTVNSLQIHARNISITWQPGADNYSPVRNFTIQYKRRDHEWATFPKTIPPLANSYIVTGLRPNTFYQFRVAATNDIGMSDYSQESASAITESDKPDGAPQNLRVVALSRTSIRASWQTPAEDTWNGQLLSYVVQFRQVQQQDFQEEPVEFDTNSVLLPNLVISQTYEVQVLAMNIKGRGPPSTPATIYVGEAAPTASPSNVQAANKSSSSIEVTWVAPPPETQNGGLSGYKVLFYKNNSGNEVEEQRISAETHFLLEGLETFTFYFISVQAYNLAGEGPRSGLVIARTSEGVPTAPGPLQFTNITLRQITVTFLPPVQPNGKILLYEMEYFPIRNGKQCE
ncbi:protein sidekick-2-like [Littorina saxatilis]|uniref:protein sidekick-2-like n=1 Tax=Littorina saxatilis TaxID=31220 RepID=UPI0038B49D2E